jgi:hypothetical protein
MELDLFTAHAADKVCLPCSSAERAFPVTGAGGAVRRVQQPGVENRSISSQSRWVKRGGHLRGDRWETRCHDRNEGRRAPGRTAGWRWDRADGRRRGRQALADMST